MAKKRVLVIEPNQQSARVCRCNLEALGCYVMILGGWYDGLPECIIAWRPFVAILVATRVDGMPSGKDGVELVRLLRSRFVASVSKLPPIFILADTATDSAWRAAQELKTAGEVRLVLLTPFPYPPAAMRMVLDRASQ